MNPSLAAALAYAAQGWPVFPCVPGHKNPITGHGFKDATTDPGQIRAWWTQHPDANVAIATGEASVDVLDIDVEADANGYTALAELQRAELLDGHGAMVRTRSGGLHVYFKGTSQRSSDARDNSPVDFKASGGYVLAPPSYVEADDKPAGHYEFISEDEATAVLDWRIVHDLLVPPPAFQQPPAERAARNGDRNWPGDDYATRTPWPEILGPADWVQVRQIGGVRYWRRPGKTGRGISASTRDDGGLWVFSTNAPPFQPETLYSKFGAYTELEHGGDYKAAAAQLRRDDYGSQTPALSLLSPPPAEAAQADWWADLAARYEPLDWHKLWDETPADEEWIIYPLLAAGRSIAVYSPPKAGKSLLALEAAAAVAAGRPILGQPAQLPRRVLYVDLENSRRDIKDRLADLGYKPDDLANLIYLSFPGLPALDSAEGGRHIVALTLAYDVTLIVIDTVSRVISGGENDADTFAALYRYALAPLKGRGISVFRLDHAGKDATKGQRGSSAKNADVDAVWTLSAAGPIISLHCEMSRTVNDHQLLTLRRERDPLRHEVSEPNSLDRVQAMIAKLDQLNVPRTDGQVRCRKALKGAKFPVDSNVLAEAVRNRKLRFSPPDGQQIGSEAPAGQSDLTAQQIGTDSPDAGASAEPISAEGVSICTPPQIGDGAPDSPPVCTDCGERHEHGACVLAGTP